MQQMALLENRLKQPEKDTKTTMTSGEQQNIKELIEKVESFNYEQRLQSIEKRIQIIQEKDELEMNRE